MLLSLLLACSQPPLPEPTAEPEAPAPEFPQVEVAPLEVVAADALTDDDRVAVVDGTTQLAVDLYGQLAATEGDVFYSPWSVSVALGMTWAGARGETATQMGEVMRVGLPPERFHAALGDAAAQVVSADHPYEIAVANRLFGEESVTFREPFLALVADDYGAPLEQVSYITDAPGAVARINGWVSEQTHERIPVIVTDGDIDALTRLVLVNAIYFKGAWATEFETDDTHPAPFHRADGTDVDAQLMHLTYPFAYHDGDGFKVLAMPYTGGGAELMVVLPDDPDGLPALEEQLSAATLAAWRDGAHERKVEVFLPRFRLDTGYTLNEPLRALGMVQAFGPEADLSGMTGDRSLYISKVLHKAFVEVTEEGTEAAAATAVIATRKGGPARRPRRPPVFRADHPFLFVLRDTSTGAVLFMGRLADPS